MASNEVEFLKNLVQKLNAELSRYQKANAIQSEPTEVPLGDDGIAAPWLVDQSLLSPLIKEYDEQCQEIQDQAEVYREELERFKTEFSRILAENEQLHQQLGDKVGEQLQSMGEDGGDLPPTTDNEQVLQNLQAQIDSSLQEKDAAMSRWQEAEHEVDRLQRELQNEKDSHQWKVVEQQAHKMQSEYYETVGVLNKELEDTQRDLRNARQDQETLTLQNKDLKKNVKDLEQQIQWKEQEIADILFKDGIADSRITDMKKILDATQTRLSGTVKELEAVKQDKEGLEIRLKETQKRITEMEQKEMDNVTQVREAVQMTESAVMEKEQAEVELKQKEEEIDKLQDSINSLINEAGVKTRQQVDNIKQQCNERINRLTEELHRLEMEHAEKDEQLKRSLRDKRQVEAELEKAFKEAKAQAMKEKDSYEEMNRRAITAERSRDEADVKIEALNSDLKRYEMNQEQQKTQSLSQINQLQERLKQMEQEFEHLNEDRVSLHNQNDEMKTKVAAAMKEKEAAMRKFQKEMTILENDQKQKYQDYEVRLQTSEDSNRHAICELRKLLTAQQRMSARWKEECETITQKFELKINEVRCEVSSLKKRNTELTNLLRDSQQKTMEAERMITDYAKNIHRMEERVRESENRAADASKQLARNSVRQRQIEIERRSLLQELNQSDSPSRSARITDSLREGDVTIEKSQLNGSNVIEEVDNALSDR